MGWYHSHPHFAAHPSIIDIKNQVAQQFQYRDEDGAETYIAAIVAPYDDQLQGNASTMNWFHVAHEPGRIPAPEQDPLQAGCRNMCLQVRAPLHVLTACAANNITHQQFVVSGSLSVRSDWMCVPCNGIDLWQHCILHYGPPARFFMTLMWVFMVNLYDCHKISAAKNSSSSFGACLYTSQQVGLAVCDVGPVTYRSKCNLLS